MSEFRLQSAARRVLAALAIVGVASLGLSGCAPGGPPLIIPSEHDDPGSGGIIAEPEYHYPDALPAGSAQAEAYRSTVAVAMEVDRFWNYIDLLGGSINERGYERLLSELHGRPREELIAFQARLTLELFALDGLVFAEWYWENDPLTVELGGVLSVDAFLYTRAEQVAQGRGAVEEAHRTGTLPVVFDVEYAGADGEYLLYIVAPAFDRLGLDYLEEVEAAIPLSFETGANEGAWLES